MPDEQKQTKTVEQTSPPGKQEFSLASILIGIPLLPIYLGMKLLSPAVNLISRLLSRFFRFLGRHPLLKAAVFLFMVGTVAAHQAWLNIPGRLFGGFEEWSMPVPQDEAEPFEAPLRELVCPVLTEKYDLEVCEVKYTRPGRYDHKRQRVKRYYEDVGGAVHFKIVPKDFKNRIELAQDIIRMKRELPGLPKCPYVLEFDHTGSWFDDFTPDGADSFRDPAARAVIGTIVIPDGERGYDGRGDWHFDDYTPTADPMEARK